MGHHTSHPPIPRPAHAAARCPGPGWRRLHTRCRVKPCATQLPRARAACCVRPHQPRPLNCTIPLLLHHSPIMHPMGPWVLRGGLLQHLIVTAKGRPRPTLEAGPQACCCCCHRLGAQVNILLFGNAAILSCLLPHVEGHASLRWHTGSSQTCTASRRPAGCSRRCSGFAGPGHLLGSSSSGRCCCCCPLRIMHNWARASTAHQRCSGTSLACARLLMLLLLLLDVCMLPQP